MHLKNRIFIWSSHFISSSPRKGNFLFQQNFKQNDTLFIVIIVAFTFPTVWWLFYLLNWLVTLMNSSSKCCNELYITTNDLVVSFMLAELFTNNCYWCGNVKERCWSNQVTTSEWVEAGCCLITIFHDKHIQSAIYI